SRDWSSDVCSSDLASVLHGADRVPLRRGEGVLPPPGVPLDGGAGSLGVGVAAAAGPAGDLVRAVEALARVADGDGEAVALLRGRGGRCRGQRGERGGGDGGGPGGEPP